MIMPPEGTAWVPKRRYRKKPIVIHAIQWKGNNLAEIWGIFGVTGIYGPTETNPDHLILTTTHGDPAPCREGDWIVPDSQPDTFYPVKPDVFAATYTPLDDAPSGAELIAAERERQITEEGYTAEHDAEHDADELLKAATVYVGAGSMQRDTVGALVRNVWPWEEASWKPSPDPIPNLVKAGALIAAEIDRQQRAL